MFKPSPQRSDAIFSILLGSAFASLFLGQALTHLVAVLFILWLLISRPRLPWIPAFWWLAGFAAWEWISNYIGPYHGNGVEGGGIAYHFLLIFMPLCLAKINHSKLLTYIAIGATASALLIWAQALIGVDLDASPLRINWENGNLFERPPGFNGRPWETQFIHSMILLTVLSYFEWRKFKTWLAFIALFTGIILPQIRAVIIAFIAAFGIQLLFTDNTSNTKTLIRRLSVITILTLLCIGTIAALRPNFFHDLATGNGRDKIFTASFEIFKRHPHTGIGGGEHFKENYLQSWANHPDWQNNESNRKEELQRLESTVAHAHNDGLMLLVHHGWPALLLWTLFIGHCLIFLWQHGNRSERILFISLAAMHHLAGLSETYLDYSNTTYTIFLCYGLALHKPVRRYLQSPLGQS